MVYNSTDNKDIWIGYELGGNTLQNLTFTIKGTFNNGQRMYNIEHNKFLKDSIIELNILKDFIKRILSVI